MFKRAAESGDETDAHTAAQAVISCAVINDAVLAVWRAERRPIVDSPWPPHRCVYVVEASVEADLVTASDPESSPSTNWPLRGETDAPRPRVEQELDAHAAGVP